MKKYWPDITLALFFCAVITILVCMGMLAGCASGPFQTAQTREIFDQQVTQIWMVPKTMNGPDATLPPIEWAMARETSASTHMEHTGTLNGDTRTSGTITISPAGEVKNTAGHAAGFASALSAWDYFVSGVSGIVGMIIGKTAVP